jgi:hypothetical protein
LTAEQVRPLDLAEYHRYHTERRQGRLDTYRGRRPLAPGQAMAWMPETVVDSIAAVLDTYINVATFGALPMVATLLGTPEFSRFLDVSAEEYGELIAPVVERLLLAEARINAAHDPRWAERVAHALRVRVTESPARAASNQALVQRLLTALRARLPEIVAEGPWHPRIAAARLELELGPLFDTIRRSLLANDPKRGFFYTPGAVQRIGSGRYRRSPYVQIRTVCTVMDAVEVEPSGPADPIGDAENDSMPTGEERSMTDAVPDAVVPSTPEKAPSGHSCECGSHERRLVYALGRLGYDFVSTSRRDSLQQKMSANASVENPAQLLAYLAKNPWDAQAVQWLLLIEGTPVYVVEPQGPYAREGFELLQQFLREQLTEDVERVSIPGVVVGSATLRGGFSLPLVNPELRGMFSWSSKALVDSVLAAKHPTAKASQAERSAYEKIGDGVHGFLDRVYYGLRNLGQSSHERALNFAATSALQLESVYAAAVKEELELDTISVEPNPIARSGADCWDVQLSFFAPTMQPQTLRKIYRFTIDVTDVVPVNVSKVRSWFVR